MIGNVAEFVSTFGFVEGAFREILPVTTAAAIPVGAVHYWKYHSTVKYLTYIYNLENTNYFYHYYL
ncbi:MAG: hypothetical protein WCF23_04910 [Candidatus Nitrosopolaris sp.]